MSLRIPVLTQEPVQITQETVKKPGRFRSIVWRNGAVAPCPAGQTWELVSMYLQLDQAASSNLRLLRPLGPDVHILWLRAFDTRYAIGSPGVDTARLEPYTTFPLPAITLEGGDYVDVDPGAATVDDFDMHVIEREVRE